MTEDNQWNDFIVSHPIHLDAQEWLFENQYRDYREEWQDMKQQYLDILHNLDACEIKDMKFYNSIFGPLWQKYKDDEITLDSFINELENKANIYLQEL